MNITLIQTTPNAREVIILSQKTRLLNSADRWQEILDMPEEEKQEAMEYAFKTISGAFEFIDYLFLLEGVSRALTHQLVRYRIGTSFSQQSQMFKHLEELHFLDEDIEPDNPLATRYRNSIRSSFAAYHSMMNDGCNVQVARGVLPTNTLTNILVKINLRSLMNLLHQRLCLKITGEFQAVAAGMQAAVVKVHPWAAPKLGMECLTRGVCIYPSAKNCFIRKGFMDRATLDGFSDEDKLAIRKTYKALYGFDPQPHGEEDFNAEE